MGVSISSSNRVLPSTHLFHAIKQRTGSPPDTAGPPDPERVPDQPHTARARLIKALRNVVHISVLISEEWYRQVIAWWHLARGRVMIYDRHFFIDYYAYDITRPHGLVHRLHGRMLKKLYPRPQLVLFLDAPGQVLFERKGEGSPELLERRRGDYMAMKAVIPCFAVIDVTQPVEVVTQQAQELVCYFKEHGALPDGW